MLLTTKIDIVYAKFAVNFYPDVDNASDDLAIEFGLILTEM